MMRKAGTWIIRFSLSVGIISSVCLGVSLEEKISEQVAVVTELPSAGDVTYWDISLQTDLPNNRLKVKATCTLRNTSDMRVDSLDFDILAREKFYGTEVEIAKIARLINGKEVDVTFKRFLEEEPDDPCQAGTLNYPFVTRVFLSPAVKEGEACQLMFNYTITCPDIKQRRHYNLIWEPEEGLKETCLISDFSWYPCLASDLQKWLELGKKKFFLRESKPAWRVTLTHPAELEGMVIDGKLQKTERVGSEMVSTWRSIVGGRPQVFVGPAERLEKKGEGATAVFLLPKDRYNPEFVDAIADLAIHAYRVYTDWYEPLEGNEIHIVATSGIGGGHGAFLGMTIGASYFQRNKSDNINESGKFFDTTVAHELAHAWWGHSVSSYGRGTKFLRESLANFSTWTLAQEYYGMNLFKSSLHRNLIDQGRAEKPLFNAESDEDALAYQKGAVVVDILRQEMGDEVFFRMLKEFARRYKNAHVTFIDFVSLCNDVSRRHWMPFFYQWCYGKGCPAYHLVGFESKEGKEGWETTVKIRNDGQGIVQCPLELRMEKASRGEVFWVRGGQESTFLYKTGKKVTDVVIDPEEIAYQADLAARRKDPAYLVKSLGSGRKSNQEIASKYKKEWLDRITDPWLLLKTGIALYDVKRYDEALAVFEKMEEKGGRQRVTEAVAVIWQGHMLDLLKKRQEAISRYEKVAAMETKREIYMRHDNHGLAYYPSPYAREMINKPFTRVENRDDD